MDGTQPDSRPDVKGASRGTGDPERDADRAGGGRRAQGSTEYTANGEPQAAENQPAEDQPAADQPATGASA